MKSLLAVSVSRLIFLAGSVGWLSLHAKIYVVRAFAITFSPCSASKVLTMSSSGLCYLPPAGKGAHGAFGFRRVVGVAYQERVQMDCLEEIDNR